MDVREKLSTEKRLIDADALLEKMKRTSRYFDVLFDVEEMPTVDAVEVVRCRNCRKFKTYVCRMVASGYDDFCSYGERKEGAN